MLRQVRGLLRPETGVAVALDVDSHYADLLAPETPVADGLLQRMNDFRARQGAVPDHHCGRRLRGLLEEVRLQRPSYLFLLSFFLLSSFFPQAGFVRGGCGLALSSSDDFGAGVLRRTMRETQYEPVATAAELTAAREETERVFPDRWAGPRLDPRRPLMLSAMFVCTAWAPPAEHALREIP